MLKDRLRCTRMFRNYTLKDVSDKTGITVR